MDIMESISIWHLIFQICGLSQLKRNRKNCSLQKNKLLQMYTAVVIFSSICILFLGIFGLLSIEKSSENVHNTVDFIQLIGIQLAHIVSTAEAFFQSTELKQIIRHIQEIDRLFEVSLNINVENEKCRLILFKWSIGMFAIYFCAETYAFVSVILGPDPTKISYWIYYSISFIICGVRYFQYLLFIIVIKHRLNKLSKVIDHITLAQKQGSAQNLKSTTRKTFYKEFRTKKANTVYACTHMVSLLVARELYNRIWELTVSLNNCFGLSILVNIGNDFLTITSSCYWVFLRIERFTTVFSDFFRITGTIISFIPHLLNVVALALICHNTVESTSDIALTIHRIEIDIQNDNHNSMIEQFSLQLLLQRIQFTAFGFFTIDCSLLYTIVGATTTYLIILIQFHMSEQKDFSNPIIQNVVTNST